MVGFLRSLGLASTLLLDTALLGVLGSISPAAISDVTLPSYPLAVKSPFLSTWVPGDQIKDAATAQAQFWDGTDLTWLVLARVGGDVYSLFGDTGDISDVTAATTASYSYTSSHTYIEMTAGTATFILDFFSPVLPATADLYRHSLPYSYLTVNVTSTTSTSIQVMSAIDYSWTGQDGASALNYTTTDDSGFFWYYNADAYLYSENGQMASYGSVLFATLLDGSSLTRGCNTASAIYEKFEDMGYLGYDGTEEGTCGAEDLVALSEDLGTVDTTAASVTFAVGLDRTYAINYLGTAQTGAYRANWSYIPDAVDYVLTENLAPALASSLALDSEVQSRAEDASGDEYAAILAASVRQAFGALEVTVPLDDMTAAPWVFLKEISSDGNVNTVDVIFQSWPIFISLNPSFIPMLFEPILAYLQTGAWPHPWVVHDLGSDYPNATGHDDGVAEQMPLFETSTLFILLQAYANYTGDTSVADKYATLLEGYAEWLAPEALYPTSQLTSVDAIAASPNQTALAIQAAIGLSAASIITGNTTYRTIALDNAKHIYTDGLGLDGTSPADSTHFTYNYGNDTTWNVVFAGYADVLLALDTFPADAWALQSQWYNTSMQEGGLPWAGPETDPHYDSTLDWGLADWNMEVAAISSASVQDQFVQTTYTFLTNQKNTIPFGTKYVVFAGDDEGDWLANEARSTVGTMFAILAMEQGWWYESS